MSLLVNEMLCHKSLKQAELIGGEQGLVNEVSNIMVMEAPDIEGWSEPGQVLLSSLYSMQHYTNQEQQQFMQKLAELSISALIIKINRFVDKIPDGIIQGGNRWNIPIIQIPIHVKYSAILIDIMQTLFNQKVKILDYYRTVHNQFTDLALRNLTTMDIVNTLAELVKKPVTICDERYNPLFTTDENMKVFQICSEDPLKQYPNMIFPYFRQVVIYPDQGGRLCTQMVISVQALEVGELKLIVHEIGESINELDFMAIENAATFLQLDMLKQFAVAEVRRKYKNDIFDDLINGKYSTREKMLEHGMLIGLHENMNYRLVVWQFKEENTKAELDAKQQYSHSQLEKKLALRVKVKYPRVVYRIMRNRIIFIFRAQQEKDDFTKDVEHAFTSIHNELKKDKLLLRVAIGDTSNIYGLPENAKKTLRIIQQAEIFIKGPFFLHYKDLGIYTLLSEINDIERLTDLIPQKLVMLNSRSPELLETLRQYLGCNQRIKETAKVLFVHHKTVSYRLEKMKQITGINLDDAEELLQLNIGLRIYKILEQKK